MRILNQQAIFGIAALLTAGMLRAQDSRIVTFEGVINDYSPSTVAGGPYEMHGVWWMEVQRSGSVDFTADLTMETSDYGVMSAAAVDPANPATRMPHTHHISITDAPVSYDTSVCPANSPATPAGAVVINAPVVTSGNGGPAPFDSKGPSTLQVCVTGGSQIEFSNVTLVYTGPATGHFGTQPIHGVVTKVSTR